MKRIFTLALFFFLALTVTGQTDRSNNPLWLGLNFGSSWQSSDIQYDSGIGFGATLGKYSKPREDRFLFLGGRLRYLQAWQYGQDHKRSYGIQHNSALNGINDPSLNYYSSPGYAFLNHRTKMTEFSFELMLGLNKPRMNGWMWYLFGGAGLVKGKTSYDQRDMFGSKYNYAFVDSVGTRDMVLSDLELMQDGEYETTAEGSVEPKWKFMPSLGFGWGYHWRHFGLGLEYKHTWTLTDVFEGQRYTVANNLSTNKDRYHYGGFFLKFGLGGGKGQTTNNNTAGNTQTNPNVYTNPDQINTTNTNNTNTNTNTTTQARPDVRFTNPSSSPHNTTQSSINVNAVVENVNNGNNISVTVNNNTFTAFNFNTSNKQLKMTLNLLKGANTIQITGTNASGSDTETMIINYQDSQGNLPVVTITDPLANPHQSSAPNITVRASVTGVNSKDRITVRVNGAVNNTFSYTKNVVQVSSGLIPGNNVFEISASNDYGQDSKSVTVQYNQAVNQPLPVVTISYPGSNPHSHNSAQITMAAMVQNVQGQGNISVKQNGNSIPFTFNPSTRALSIPLTLVTGTNAVNIVATNASGTGSANQIINYKSNVVTPAARPVVTFTNPNVSPMTVSSNSFMFTGQVLNVSSKNEIRVLVNSIKLTNFNYDAATKLVTFNASLKTGSNVAEIIAKNSGGEASATTTVNVQPRTPVASPPQISLINPGVNPYNTVIATVPVQAKITNISDQNQISVTFNGQPFTGFSWNQSSQLLNLSTNVVSGENKVVINASNASGSDSETLVINFSANNNSLAPDVNIISPAVNPFTSGSAQATVNAKILNVTNQNQINVSLNGALFTTFTFSPASNLLTLHANLNPGNNTLIISAKNSVGSDSETKTLIYNAGPSASLPVVTFEEPGGNQNSAEKTVPVTVSVLNVPNSNAIQVTVNNNNFTSWNYNMSTKKLKFSVNLASGANTIKVKATNSSGADEESIILTYSFRTDPPPEILLNVPASGSQTVASPNFTVRATLLNIMNSNEISVKKGNVNVPFQFDVPNKTLTFNVTLNEGQNLYVITATNDAGSISKNVTITYKKSNVAGAAGGALGGGGTEKPRGGPAPKLILSDPQTLTLSTPANSYNFTLKTENVDASSKIVVEVNGVVVQHTFNKITKEVKFTAPSLKAGSNSVVVSVQTSSGSDKKSFTVTVAAAAPKQTTPKGTRGRG